MATYTNETYYIIVPRGEMYTTEDSDRAARRNFFNMLRGHSHIGSDGTDDLYWIVTTTEERDAVLMAARAAYIDVYDGPRFDTRVW